MVGSPKLFGKKIKIKEKDMKYLVIFALLSLSTQAIANCSLELPTELDGKSLHNFRDGRSVKKLGKTGILFNESRQAQWKKVLPGFELEDDCAQIMATVSFAGKKSGNLYHAFYTNEDHCDGGNSYGFITDANLEVVAEIQDSDVYCVNYSE